MINISSLKVVFVCFLYGLVIQQSVAQPKFPKIVDYDSLLNQARQQNKPMFLVIHRSDETFSPFRTSISQKTQAVLHEQFVSGIIQLEADDINHPLPKIYDLNTPIYLFADSDGSALLRYNKPITEEETLIHLVDSALVIAEGETMGKLMQQYRKGNRSRALLMNLFSQYRAFDQYTDQHVLNDYIAQLTVQELNNFETVVFLLKCGPVYNSPIYHLVRTNRKMVDSLYATLPLPMRKEINVRITRRTFREALDKQDYLQAQNLGAFVGQSWRPHYLRAQIGQSFYPMEYKRLSRDTSVYVPMARNYYNTFYYNVSPDSLAKLDFAHNRNKDMRRGSQTLDSAENIHFQRWIERNQKRYNDKHAQSLSYGARQLLDFGRNNPEALFDAIRWQQKAIVLRPERGQYHHTLAQLLYRVGFYVEAEAEQQQAITLYKSNKPRLQQMRKILKQMQARSF